MARPPISLGERLGLLGARAEADDDARAWRAQLGRDRTTDARGSRR